MHARRAGPRSEPTRDDAAARRLALIAADLGAPSVAEGSAATAAPDTEPAWWADHTRVVAQPDQPVQSDQSTQPARPVESVGAQEGAEPPAVPRPGRHAARRRTGLRPLWRRA
ncbi:hypothetical protein, partial [Nocardioides sp. SYSU DS0651]|uniref:hypothetical protein n=1 Tax=Nocardioides sp. SYSU DS0651 TaxID=3415955 RepID=UPI003F4C6E1A